MLVKIVESGANGNWKVLRKWQFYKLSNFELGNCHELGLEFLSFQFKN